MPLGCVVLRLVLNWFALAIVEADNKTAMYEKDSDKMHELDLESSAVDWAIDFPLAVTVFEEAGIDYHCGGKSLEYLCVQQGLDPQSVLARLRRLALTAGRAYSSDELPAVREAQP
jgi:regulator of cell morphogenesis and NO signaling